jgi:hypothetical protein
VNELVKCGICSEQAFRNKRGQLLLHTRYGAMLAKRRGSGTYATAEVCPGSVKGARP